MSFVAEFNSLPLDALVKKSLATNSIAARETLGKNKISLADFAALISPAAGELLETMSRQSHAMTQQRFGKTIRMSLPTDRKEKKLETHYYFIPEESPTFKLKVKKVTNVVGREGTCDVYVESNQVSRRHCLLQVTERGLLVKDLESTNGTFVNGIPMTDGYINEGDRLGLGTYVMTLHREKT